MILSPDFDDPKEMYAFFGLAAYKANLLEVSFINWTAALKLGGVIDATQCDFNLIFEESEKKTLGQLLGLTKSLTDISEDFSVVLNKALKERNRLIHNFYREHAQNLIHLSGRKIIISELIQMIKIFEQADVLVTPVYLSLWEKLGLSEAMIEEELALMYQEVRSKS